MNCPTCKSLVDIDEEELDEGDTLSCDECGTALKVASLHPVEFESADLDVAEEDDEDFEDGDEEDEDGFEEVEGEEADEWS